MKRSTRARQLNVDRQLVEMARQAEAHLLHDLAIVNGLNVFPVPDGDTGTNMLATIQAALAAGATAEALASGALMGARGNSGVILSQLFRAQALNGVDLGRVFVTASDFAREAVSRPSEGTMLSVLAALVGVEAVEDAIVVAEAAVARTPAQLPILREAGVVDAGAYGLLLVLRGWYEAIVGAEPRPIEAKLLGLDRDFTTTHPAMLVRGQPAVYGHCVTLLIDAPAADEVAVRRRAEGLGDCVLVVASEGQLKVHAHVLQPEPLLAYATELGRVLSSEISNIDEQTAVATQPLVAVAPGEGFAAVFRGLGAATVLGGPGNNPSTAQLMAACEPLLARFAQAFLLPNNANIEAAARQAAQSRSAITVIPTHSAPQGIAAALAFVPDAGDNVTRMTAAAKSVMTAEVVRAARTASVSGVNVRSGDQMVVVEGELIGTGSAGLEALGRRVKNGNFELATVYSGAAATRESAETLAARFPDLQVEVVRGDQPHADFIVSFE